MMAAGSHDAVLVVLSVLVAIAASFTALDLAGRVRAGLGWVRHAWLMTAALAMGGGIWAMHFIAMLAFNMPGMEIAYDVGLTLLSLVVAVAATGTGFLVITLGQGRPRPAILMASGIVMGLGIVAMHYIGMAAMRMPMTIHYGRVWVAVSILIAIGAATIALWLSVRTSRLAVKIVAAVAMGLAVSGMHYAAMQGLSFTAHSAVDRAAEQPGLGQAALAVAVAASTFLILFLALLAAMVDRRLAVLTEREARALRQSEERFRSLYTRTPLPLHSLDREGRIEHVSDAWLDLLGFSRAEVIGRPFRTFLSGASASEAGLTDWSARLQSGAPVVVECQVVTKGGALRDVIASAQVEQDQDGRFVRILGGLTDITGRRQAEEALRQAQKMEAVGQLTGGVAHDFNNLLTIIRSSVDLLRRPGLPDERRGRYLDAVAETVERAAKLTGQLLAFARRQTLTPEVFEVGQRLREVADMLDTVTGARIAVVTELADMPCYVNADVSQFDTAIVNMAVNARDAMDGEGTLTLSLQRGHRLPPIRGHAGGDFDCVAVSLTDTGAGIPADHIGRIFEPFFTTKAVGKGTGLGLSQVFGFAKQSGGDIAVESTLGRGTTFTLFLPEVCPKLHAPTMSETKTNEDLPTGEGERILLVEDNLEVGRFASQVLADLGYEITWATNAQEALTRLEEARGRFDLVFSDVVMPGMSGLDLARELRRRWPGLPVLLTSGYSEVLARDENHGFRLLQKPYSADQLARVLRKTAAERFMVGIAS